MHKLAMILAFALTSVAFGCAQPEGRARNKDATKITCGLAANQIGTFLSIPAGSFVAGARPLYPEEGPSQRLRVEGFEIQRHEVTNDQFRAFVTATRYQTDAEKSAASGRADGGSAVFVRALKDRAQIGAWALTRGATWQAPDGPGSNIEGKGNWPVVHVSYRDARAYATWAKARLPSEMEWEYAASLGLPLANDSRSGAFDAKGAPRANTWQGLFPMRDEGSDGFEGIAPIGCFAPDNIGLSDMIGNVWEWTAQTDPSAHQAVIKGGSHLCADNFCGRFRPEARQYQDIDFSTNHIGFRIVRDMGTTPPSR
jgi:formylglycine-generating enzyme